MIYLTRGREWDHEEGLVGDLELAAYDNEAAATLHAGDLWAGIVVPLELRSNYLGRGGTPRLEENGGV